MKIYLTLLLSLSWSSLLLGQNPHTNSQALNRYLDSTDQYITIPLTDLRLLTNTEIDLGKGWMTSANYKNSNQFSTFILEMNPNQLPDSIQSGETRGMLLIAFELEAFRDMSISMDTVNYKLLNHYSNQYISIDEWGEDEPIDKINGTLIISEQGNDLIVNGQLSVLSSRPYTKQVITLDDVYIKKSTLEEYNLELERARKERAELREAQMETVGKILTIRNQFYDSLFNHTKFPQNELQCTLNSSEVIRVILDKSYIVISSEISPKPTKNLFYIFTSHIYYPIEGSSYVINMFFEDSNDIISGDSIISLTLDDDTTYSLLLSTPSISVGKVYTIDSLINNANLSLWRTGPLGQIIDTRQASGSIEYTSKIKGIVKGNLNLHFIMEDLTDITIEGKFHLPLVTLEDFDVLDNLMNEVKGK